MKISITDPTTRSNSTKLVPLTEAQHQKLIFLIGKAEEITREIHVELNISSACSLMLVNDEEEAIDNSAINGSTNRGKIIFTYGLAIFSATQGSKALCDEYDKILDELVTPDFVEHSIIGIVDFISSHFGVI